MQSLEIQSRSCATPDRLDLGGELSQTQSVFGTDLDHVHIPEASLCPADLRCQAQPMQGGTQRIDLADFDRDGPSQCDQPGRRLPFALPMESSKLLPIIAAGENVNQCVQERHNLVCTAVCGICDIRPNQCLLWSHGNFQIAASSL